MKKFFNMSILFLATFLFAACGSGSSNSSKGETATYVNEIDDSTLEVTFTHVGDKLKKVEQKMVYSASYLGLEDGKTIDDTTKEYYEKQINSQYSEYGGKGTSISTEFSDDSMIVTMSIDLEKADDSVASLLVGTSDLDNVSFKDTVEEFEAQGYKEKK